jgi:hypothetical protein
LIDPDQAFEPLARAVELRPGGADVSSC